jgi:hypothetical protein
MRAHRLLDAAMVAVLLASACNKKEAAKAQAPAAARQEPASEKSTDRPSASVAAHEGFFLPGSHDLDACAVLTPADLQPVFGKSIAKSTSAVAGMSLCSYEREGAPDVGVTLFTTAGLHQPARDQFAKMTKGVPKETLTEIAGAGDGAVFIQMTSMLWVHKKDVIVQVLAEKPESGPALTEPLARKLAAIVGAKLAQLPVGAGLEQKVPPVANAAAKGAFDVCGLVTEAEAAAIFGGSVRGSSVRGIGAQDLASCFYVDKTTGTQLLGVIAWTPDALRKAGQGTAAQMFTGMVGSPIFRGQKVAGLGDEAAHSDEMLLVRAKNSLLQLSSRQPEAKLKAFAKIAISRL